MNHSLIAADRGTHIRMLLASFAGVLVFIVALVGSEVTRDFGTIVRYDGPTIIKAGTSTVMVSQDTAHAIR